MSFGRNSKQVMPPKAADVLILLADWFFQQIDFDMTSLFGQFPGGTKFRFIVCSARSNAVVKLPDEPSPVPAGMSERLTISRYGPVTPVKLQRFPNDGMLDVFPPLHIFQLGIFQNDSRPKRLVDGDVNVPVDRGRQHETAVLSVVRRKIGAAST